jgi:hypothetical protein
VSVSPHQPSNNSAAVTCASKYHGFCWAIFSHIFRCNCHIDDTLETAVVFYTSVKKKSNELDVGDRYEMNVWLVVLSVQIT